jgi:hypothetical protein
MRSCCVIGLPDEDLGNVPYAVVELSEPVSDEDLMAHLRQRLTDTPGLTGISASISTAEPRSACAGRWPGSGPSGLALGSRFHPLQLLGLRPPVSLPGDTPTSLHVLEPHLR